MVFGFTGGFIITWIHYLRGTWQYKGIVRTKERTSIRAIAKMEALYPLGRAGAELAERNPEKMPSH